jgi:hypothetical protein
MVNADRELIPYCRSRIDSPRCFGWLLGRVGRRPGRHRRAVCSGPVGVSVQGDDVGVVDEAVDGRGDDDVPAEGLPRIAVAHLLPAQMPSAS